MQPVAPGPFDFSFDDLELAVDGWKGLPFHLCALCHSRAALVLQEIESFRLEHA